MSEAPEPRRVHARSWGRDQLRDWAETRSDDDLPTLCREVERFVLDVLVPQVVESHFRALSKDHQHTGLRVSGNGRLNFDGIAFETRITEHRTITDRIDICVQTTKAEESKLLPRLVREPVAGYGRYKQLALAVDSRLETLCAPLMLQVREVVEAVYSALVEHVEKRFTEIKDSTAQSLYAVLRGLLGDLSDHVRPYAIVEGRGFYVHDQISRSLALRAAEQSTLRTKLSAIEHVVEFHTSVLPGDIGYALEAIRSSQPVIQDSPNSIYADHGVTRAEIAIYKTDIIAVHPLVGEGTSLLVAGYPINLRQKIGPILDEAKTEFRILLANHANLLQAFTASSSDSIVTSRLVDFRRLLWRNMGVLGEYSGGFAKVWAGLYGY